MHAIFTRKTNELVEACFSGKPEPIEIEDCRVMTPAEYDDFTNSMLDDRAWLAGKGGRKGGKTMVIEISAPGRKTLYIDPEGSQYARYVGIAW